MNMKHWKIGTRLGGAFALLLVLLAACIWFAIASLRQLNDGTARIVDEDYPKTILAYESLDVVNRNARAMRNMLLWDQPGEVSRERQVVLQNRQENTVNLEKLAALIQSDEGKATLKAVQDAREAYRTSQQAFLELMDAGKKQEATTFLLNEVQKHQSHYFDAARNLIKLQDGRVRDKIQA